MTTAAPITPPPGTWAEAKRTLADVAPRPMPDPDAMVVALAGHFRASDALALAWLQSVDWKSRTPPREVDHRHASLA